MEYALSLYPDPRSENILLKWMTIAAKSSGNHYVPDILMPPHITIAYFAADDVRSITDWMESSAFQIKQGTLIWPYLGSFPPAVLYAGAVLNEYLLEAVNTANAFISSIAVTSEYYRPYQWVPHTSLALKLANTELYRAFEAVASVFQPINGQAERISLASCNPFQEIHVMQLQEKEI